MIRTLQRKFIWSSMLAVTVLIVLMLGAINAANVLMVQRDIDLNLHRLSETQSPSLPGEGPGMQQMGFAAYISPDGRAVLAGNTHLDREEMEDMVKIVLREGKTQGEIDSFRYLVRVDPHTGTTTLAFVDTDGQIGSYLRVILLSLGIGLLCWGGMLLLVLLLSKKAIGPIAQNMERQKRFITDAGHEIKTPLAIIRANTEAMELYQGENKWSRNIKDQTVRLDGLTKNLLLLARMDESENTQKKETVDLSFMLRESLGSFAEPFALRKIQIRTELDCEVCLQADPEQLRQLLSILLDNALKYTDEGGYLLVCLCRKGTKPVLQMQNTCQSLPQIPAEQLFERFSRGTQARTQKTGGCGIGLSVAAAIMESLGGSISCSYCAEKEILFTLSFG